MNRFIYLIISLLPFTAKGQLEKFCYDVSGKGKVNIDRLIDFIIPKNGHKNIYLLSESLHSHEGIYHLKNVVASALYERIKLDALFVECPKLDELLNRSYAKNSISIEDIGLNGRKISNEEINSIKNRRSYKLIEALSNVPDSIFHSIDIGVSDFSLGLQHLCSITQRALPINTYIQKFCDSLLKNNTGVYHQRWQGLIFDETYNEFNAGRKSFLQVLKNKRASSDIIQAWENVFAKYESNYLARSLFRSVEGRDWKMDENTFLKINSYRDEFLFRNFEKNLPKDWKNLAVSFSTLHLMNLNDYDVYKEYELESITTFGKILHGDIKYRPYLRRIAFVCLKDSKKKDRLGFNHVHERESLEYKLSKRFDFAYVDLEAYRNSDDVQKEPFYLSPTLFRYELFNWENMFDGIVFAKNCSCNLNL